MIIGTRVRVASDLWGTGLTQNDYARWAAIDTKCTAGAHVVINHVDALPRADVHASFAHDAFRLIDVNELFWFDCALQILSINFNKLIFRGPLWHRWVCVSACHFESGFLHQRTTISTGWRFFDLLTALLPPAKTPNSYTNEYDVDDNNDDVA